MQFHFVPLDIWILYNIKKVKNTFFFKKNIFKYNIFNSISAR